VELGTPEPVSEDSGNFRTVSGTKTSKLRKGSGSVPERLGVVGKNGNGLGSPLTAISP